MTRYVLAMLVLTFCSCHPVTYGAECSPDICYSSGGWFDGGCVWQPPTCCGSPEAVICGTSARGGNLILQSVDAGGCAFLRSDPCAD